MWEYSLFTLRGRGGDISYLLLPLDKPFFTQVMALPAKKTANITPKAKTISSQVPPDKTLFVTPKIWARKSAGNSIKVVEVGIFFIYLTTDLKKKNL